jgi:hypothetical protein
MSRTDEKALGSAPVESTIKLFNKRVKGTEKFWRPSTLEAVLHVRAAQLCQDHRDECQWARPLPCRAARTPLRQAASRASPVMHPYNKYPTQGLPDNA